MGSGAAGTAGTAGGGMAASLRFTGGARSLEGLWVKPAGRYPVAGAVLLQVALVLANWEW